MKCREDVIDKRFSEFELLVKIFDAFRMIFLMYDFMSNYATFYQKLSFRIVRDS